MKAIILLGSNLSDRLGNLNRAISMIDERVGVIETHSSVYETKPWGNLEQDDFLNQIVIVQTMMSPQQLLKSLLEIETEMGRMRTEKWAPRLIDLDILYYGQMVINENDLVVPHPFIAERRFTLIPLVEIIPQFKHPVFHRTNSELLADTTDFSEVFLHKSRE